MEGAQLVGEIDVQRRLRCADADTAVLQSGTGTQLLLGLLDLDGSGGNAGIEQFSLRRQRYAPVAADKQHAAQLLLQPVHGVGHIGLVAAQHPGRLGEILVLGHIVEDLIVVPRHIHRDPSMSILYLKYVKDTFYISSFRQYNSPAFKKQVRIGG